MGSRLAARRCPFPLASMSRTRWRPGSWVLAVTGGCSRVVVMVVGPFEDRMAWDMRKEGVSSRERKGGLSASAAGTSPRGTAQRCRSRGGAGKPVRRPRYGGRFGELKGNWRRRPQRGRTQVLAGPYHGGHGAETAQRRRGGRREAGCRGSEGRPSRRGSGPSAATVARAARRSRAAPGWPFPAQINALTTSLIPCIHS